MDFAPTEAETTDLLDMHDLLQGIGFSSVTFGAECEIFDPSNYIKDFSHAHICEKYFQFGLQEEEDHMDVQETELFVSSDTGNVSMLWDDCVQSFSSHTSAEYENRSSPCSIFTTRDESVENTSHIRSLVIPSNDSIDVDDQVSLLHLLQAHAEATDKEQTELLEVIQRRISEKANPLGETLERFSFNFFQSQEHQYDNLRKESIKIFEIAFKTFYHVFPLGKFSHLASNSEILEAMPTDAETLNIIDFDMGEGIQWAPVIETLSRKKKGLTLIAIKWERDCPASFLSLGNFENTKTWLIRHAASVGVKLKVMEVKVRDLACELNKRNKKDWLAFNCQTGLPHMARLRSHERVLHFLRVAKDIITDSTRGGGIITFGDGEVLDELTRNSDYFTFFNERLAHSQALLQAMERCFTDQLAEAKMTMECLFIAPKISSLKWVQQWKNMKKNNRIPADMRLQGVKMSTSSLSEAKAIVREGECPYTVRTGGQNENELSLEWRGTPLVKISAWR